MLLRLLSYNIAVGIETRNYRDYVVGGWKHFFPHQKRQDNLRLIANFLAEFDIVAVQEVDCGSLRSNYVNQLAYLAQVAGFPIWYHQVNRDFGPWAQHGNGLLSRYQPLRIVDHKLPGMFPGRGAIAAEYWGNGESLLVVAVHLSLGGRTQDKQLDFIAKLAAKHQHVIIMGDMNCSAAKLSLQPQLRQLGLLPVGHAATFPSWQPRRSLDHILVSKSIQVRSSSVVHHTYSDHLPLAVDIELPLQLTAAAPKLF